MCIRDRVTGGGTIAGQCGTSTFSISVQRKQNGGPIKGSFSYSDPGAGITIKSTTFTTFFRTGPNATFGGPCGTGCTFTVSVHDGGEPSNDTFTINATTASGTYSASGTLRSGNIQVRSS